MFSYNWNFNCQVFSVCQNTGYNTRFTSDQHEQPDWKEVPISNPDASTRFVTFFGFFFVEATKALVSALPCPDKTIAICCRYGCPNTSSIDFRELITRPPASSWRPLKWPHLATLTNLPLVCSRCEKRALNAFSLLQCYPLFLPSVPYGVIQDLCSFFDAETPTGGFLQ